MFLDFASAWEAVVDVVPSRDAIVQGDRRLTYEQFDDAAARVATAIEAAGVPEGATVALYLYNSPEYLICQYGAFKHRAVPVNVNYRYLDDELVYLLENSDARVLVYHTSLSATVERVKDRLDDVRLFVEVDDGGDHVDGAVPIEGLLASHEPQERKTRSGDDLYLSLIHI